jgi:hypothetical protein
LPSKQHRSLVHCLTKPKHRNTETPGHRIFKGVI